jgi:hypothetical protein
MTRKKSEAIICTLEKAGLYRNKKRYTMKELPDIGATVNPQVEAARWYLLRGEDPEREIIFRYPGWREKRKPQMVTLFPRGPGYPVQIESPFLYTKPREPRKYVKTNLGTASYLYFTKALREALPRVVDAWMVKIGNETRAKLKKEKGITLDFYEMAHEQRQIASTGPGCEGEDEDA